jgi:hypothetical protein
VFETPKTRTANLYVTLAVREVLDIQAGAREVDEPEVAARAWALADLRSGEYLAGEDA